jgi:catechol 2,3-dioxygenase-like lactoylglutathione lyase family enzyme
VLDHLGLAVKDYARSKAFYQKALAPLGLTLLMEPMGEAAGGSARVETRRSG